MKACSQCERPMTAAEVAVSTFNHDNRLICEPCASMQRIQRLNQAADLDLAEREKQKKADPVTLMQEQLNQLKIIGHKLDLLIDSYLKPVPPATPISTAAKIKDIATRK